MSIVNEDVALARFLLRNGANINERCIGRFFCPDDQKEMRLDSIHSEKFIMPKNTNYRG
jgi:hypothetical protein